MGVVTANYPGKTVEVNLASTRFADREIGIMDLPGTYALGAVSEDQWVARRALLARGRRRPRRGGRHPPRAKLYLPPAPGPGNAIVVALNPSTRPGSGLRIDDRRLARPRASASCPPWRPAVEG
jgi:hypothetical protein